MATLIKTNGEMVKVEINGLKDLQEAVGGFIQIAGVSFNFAGERVTPLVDEEGLYKYNEINMTFLKLTGVQLVGPVLLANDKEFN